MRNVPLLRENRTSGPTSNPAPVALLSAPGVGVEKVVVGEATLTLTEPGDPLPAVRAALGKCGYEVVE